MYDIKICNVLKILIISLHTLHIEYEIRSEYWFLNIGLYLLNSRSKVLNFNDLFEEFNEHEFLRVFI